MISADFYPTAQTFSNPTTEVTNYIPSVDSALSNAYWLGWINYDNIPDCCKMSNVTITNTELILTNDGTVQRNYNIGYFCEPVSGGYSGSYSSAYTVLNSSINSASGYNKRYVNKMDVMGIGASNIRIYYDVFVRYGTGGELTNIARSLDQPLNIALAFFIADDTINITAPTIAVTFEISASTQADEGYWFFSGNNGTYDYECYIYIKNVQIYPAIARQSTGASGGYTPLVGIGLETETDNGTIVYQDLSSSCVYSSIGRFAVALANNFDFDNTSSRLMYNNYLVSGFNCRFNRQQLLANTLYFYFDGNSCAYRYNASIFYIARVLTISEIVKLLSLYIRWDYGTVTANHYGYVANETYATYVTEDNEFTATLITGDLSDDEFKAKLRPWQYDVDEWAENDYTEEDLPPYEPGGDGDDQGSNTGSVLRPTTLGVGGTNGFITQYSLTAAQIAEIGRLLWYKFSDASAVEQYVKNYMFFTVSTTGTLNLSNLLDYFVSLRVYPFPLINVPSHAAAGQDMWIGAGIVPLTFSTNLHTINNYADYIDAGSCTIPRYYNDFRDFAHTQIMLYLPYCGTVQLNPADVVGSTLHAQYAIDFATGGVTAYVDCTTWDGSQFVIAVLTGSIGADIPLTASNAAQIAARIAGDALNFAGTVGEAISSDVGRSAQAIGSSATGDVVGAAIGVANTYAGRIGGALDVAQTGLQIATAEGVKMPMLSGGRGFGSFGAPQTAYVQIRRGIYAEGQQPTQGFKEAYGEAYSKPVQVSSCTGFTVFANVDTSGLQCDAMEREQVKKMMQAGIYI